MPWHERCLLTLAVPCAGAFPGEAASVRAKCQAESPHLLPSEFDNSVIFSSFVCLFR